MKSTSVGRIYAIADIAFYNLSTSGSTKYIYAKNAGPGTIKVDGESVQPGGYYSGTTTYSEIEISRPDGGGYRQSIIRQNPASISQRQDCTQFSATDKREGCLDALHINSAIHRDGDCSGRRQRPENDYCNKQHKYNDLHLRPNRREFLFDCKSGAVIFYSRWSITLHTSAERKRSICSAFKRIKQGFRVQDVFLIDERKVA